MKNRAIYAAALVLLSAAASFSQVPEQPMEFPGCQMTLWVPADVSVYSGLEDLAGPEDPGAGLETAAEPPAFSGKSPRSAAYEAADAVARKLEAAGFSLYQSPIVCPTYPGSKKLAFTILYEYRATAAGRSVERYDERLASAEQASAAPELLAQRTAAVKEKLERDGSVILEAGAYKVRLNSGEEWRLKISYIAPGARGI